MWRIHECTDWDSLRQFGWVRDMRGIPQSPIHHAEGDVEIHTRLVLEQLEQLPEYLELPEQEQHLVWAAALLHDVEKRSTTITDENGSIVSPGHAKKGALTARSILYREVPTPFAIREEIVGLVRYHGLPLWVFEKPDPVRALLKASLEVNTRLLVLLAKADILGRICSDQQEMLYRIEMFREFCIEQDCWGKPKEFPSDLARFLYFRKEEQTADYVPFDDRKAEVVILSAIAGSGKDHYLKQHHAEHEVISLDEMRRAQKISHGDARGNGRIIQAAKERARECLRKHQPFVWNATSITAQMREQLVDLFEVYNPVIRIVYLEVPYQQLLSQNRNRQFPIPEAALENMIAKLEVPKLWEAHTVQYSVK
ncbi:AAA family ATPase [Hymenobacter sp. BT664]|uniref:AAA family ATPase n=1 Tax=Hymenobacter montanus TaxID=2771359 RepID=A0A927BC37_9BACT|nr:AAA family ATPase [Hymenobacter montanus]MBD2767535.1 AAA family ATPase [Hymenobacter montanus]